MVSMHPVTSSNIAALGYEKGTLYIQFNSGATYAYAGVSREAYIDLRDAPSVGKHFHKMDIKRLGVKLQPKEGGSV